MPDFVLRRRLSHALVLAILAAAPVCSTAFAHSAPRPVERIVAMRGRTVVPPPPEPDPTPPPAPAAPAPLPAAADFVDDGSIPGIIRAAAVRHGANPDQLLRVAMCESGLNPWAHNRSGASGLFQFMPSTFYAHGGQNLWDPRDQADVAARMFAAGWSYQWSCR